jgi:neutral ceramidase
MGDTGVRRALLSLLNETYKGLYHAGNVAFVGTHQHSGVGGFMESERTFVDSVRY